jgi:hypothetical protein
MYSSVEDIRSLDEAVFVASRATTTASSKREYCGLPPALMSSAMCPIQSGRADRSCDFWVLSFTRREFHVRLDPFYISGRKNIATSSGSIFAGKEHYVRCYDADPVNITLAS